MSRALPRTVARLGPHWVLLIAATLEVALEAARIGTGSSGWLVLAAAISLLALGVVWRLQDELRLAPVAVVALAFHVAWVGLHLWTGQVGDQDPDAYAAYGNELLDGRYPESEYPVGAILLFTLEALLGGGSAETANRVLMIAFQVVCVLAVWSLRTRFSSWFAAVLAIWPMSTYYWQYRFDLVPAALLVLGLLLALRGRWGWSGIVLALGTAVKWVPALAFAVLVVWLAAGSRWAPLRRTTASFIGCLAAVHVPFLLWQPDRVLDTYRGQGERAITNESLWFFPLSLLGLTGDTEPVWAPAGTPQWTDVLAVATQAAVLLGLGALAVRHRQRLGNALVLAALAPAVFLLTNRVFSPQFMLVVTAALALAGALAAPGRREQLALGLLLLAATFANAFVYPFEAGPWQPYSAATFAAAFAGAGIVLVRAASSPLPLEERLVRAEPDRESVGAVVGRVRERLAALRRRPAEPPPWTEPALRWTTAAVVVALAVPTAFVASVMPYRYWDSLAFGAWSRSIAESGDLWANAGVLDATRPLFYVPQGLAWRFLLDEAWVGRLLSALFAAALVACVWALARRLAPDGIARALLPPLAVATLLASAVFANLVAAGMTDIPLAAATAATGLALLSTRLGRAYVPLVAVAAAATALAKVSGFLAIPGLALAVVVLRRRASLPGLVGLALGAGAGLAFDAWQSARLNVALSSLLRASNEGIWLERGSAARWDAFGRAEWLGEGARLVVVFGLVHGVARMAGLRPRIALSAASAAAIVWSLAGPAFADGRLDYPFAGSVLGIACWLALAAAMVAAALLADSDPIPPRTYAALVLWLSPVAIVWFWQRADEVRHLAPAWPALVLLAAAALCSTSRALARVRPAAAIVPAIAIAVLALANVPSIDGLGRDGWRDLLDLSRSGWSDRAEIENFAYGPFSYELELARENVASGERILSSNGRLAYFFPGRVEFAYARTCNELEGARFFSYLTSGESAEEAARAGQPTDPLGWLQCQQPQVTLVGEDPGIYAAFVVGGRPARAPFPEDCRIASYAGQLSDAIFGERLSYAEARDLRRRMEAIGYAGVKTERTGCSEFRVVVTGIPDDAGVREEFLSQASVNGFRITYAPAVRFPEVPPDVAAVR